jgi:hypothetical protein
MEVIEDNRSIYIAFYVQIYGQQTESVIVKSTVNSRW